MNPDSETISAHQLKELLPGRCCLVDVREPVEFSEQRIAGAKLIPLGQLERRGEELEKESTVVVMCRGGKRGAEALRKLRAMGHGNVRNLEGGILAWMDAGLAVESDRRRCLPLMQQVQLVIGLGVLSGAVLSLTVHPYWVLACAFFGAGLTLAGSTGWCGLAILLSKMPWNRVSGSSCSISGNCSGPGAT